MIAISLLLLPCIGNTSLASDTPPRLSKFEQLVQLVGEWKGAQPTLNGKEIMSVTYELTAKGTALVETVFPGSTKEMVSIYARDGQEVVMTHYCMLGNHPRMRTTKQESPNSLTLVYLDETGMRSLNDMHMHELTITLIDHYHMVHKWTLYDKGKKKVTSTFDFSRKRP